ncbi:uncharacterized protein RAG0_03496 [Rhynchosporium agropyri]|uniref:Gram-positive cocci surface proteins LPxTG domain-containing protein n=1 Tax=Rhynchosporium agropyri TaxID=914238 RepID=A0A1E1K4K2_9HELO|nr:uncharacterized protein RAG0_03496 [Rhynchosporium agropyri]
MSLATLTSSASMAMLTPSLTTTFIPQITACSENRLTMLANRAYQIWMNAPVPVPGTTITDCYPTEVMSSFLLSAGSVTQPAFAQLVCPQHYTTIGPFTSNYIACCPSSYSFHEPDVTVFKDRPAWGGTCYSPIDIPTPVLVTAYGSVGVTATSYFTATVTNAQAYAHPIDGYGMGVVGIKSILPPGASKPTNSVPSPGATTYTVLSGKNSGYIPNYVVAKTGDTIMFQFTSGNHTVTESTFEKPCDKLANGVDSGYQPITNPSDPPKFTLDVVRNTSQWFFSKQAGECGQGMTFALNPTNEQTEVLFQLNAAAQDKTPKSDSPSTGVKVGASIGAVAGLAIIIGIIFFLIRRRRQNNNLRAQDDMRDTTINKMRENSTYTDTEAGMSPTSEIQPALPFKGPELHGNSSVPELVSQRPPAELMDRRLPVEMYSPGEWETTANSYPLDRKDDVARRY